MDEKKKNALLKMANFQTDSDKKTVEPQQLKESGKKKTKLAISITLDTEDVEKLKKLGDFIFKKEGTPTVKNSRLIRAALKYAEANDLFMEKYQESK